MKSVIKTGKRKSIAILLHATGWIILFILPQFLITGGLFEDTRTTFIIFFNTFILGILFYVNFFLLVPWLMNSSRWLLYIIVAATLIASMGLASSRTFEKVFAPPTEFRDHRQPPGSANREMEVKRRRRGEGMAIYNFFITSVLVSAFAVGLRYAESSIKKSEEIKELEKEKLNSELALLKNQVSPHFFFNTLNNIYSLIAINQKDAQAAVLSLSKMMRYMLYESEQGNTRLSRELEFMKGYIDLMKLRLSDRVRLSVSFPEKYNDIDIPPLLFIPFIENAFKHGVSSKEETAIDISLTVREGEVIFTSENSVASTSRNTMPNESGIGLENVRKRLVLLFPDRHELSIRNEAGRYIVRLSLRTSSTSES